MKTGYSVKLLTHLLGNIICLICICSQASFAQKKPEAYLSSKATDSFTYKIIDGSHSTYGYDILAGGKLLVHQPSIPAIPGNEGFKTKGAADRVARLVIQKIQKGEMPPTITVEELKKLKAI